MPRTIQILPDAVANQIAAGEVVERPASVVKELVENALDAGARRIEIHLTSGGKRGIRVSDDGSGMGREDALLSLDRHATSKIQEADDLRGIRSFGFRGEALPSIASVSRFTLETAAAGEVVGTRIQVRGGTVLAVDDHPRTRGTTISVEQLFLNAPARARFLRSPAAETRAVNEALLPLTLVHASVAFLLTSDGRPLLELPATDDLVERIAGIWGEEAASELLPVAWPVEPVGDAAGASGDSGASSPSGASGASIPSGASGATGASSPSGASGASGAPSRIQGLHLAGVIQRPDRARPGFRRAHLFVDGRPFRDPAILRAADRGYRTTIPPEARPWLFLFLHLPPGQVDVNVHPTKAEVRFRDRGGVEREVEEAVRTALEGAASAATLDTAPTRPALVREPGGGFGSRGGSPRAPDPASQSPDPQFTFFAPGAGTGSSPGTEAGPGAGSAANAGNLGLAEAATQPFHTSSRGASRGPSPGSGLPPATDDATEAAGAGAGEDPGSPAVEPVAERFGDPRLWQVHDRFILAEVRDGLLLIDQHAAHERILFERIMARFDGGVEESQRLLFPLTVRLTPPEVRMVDDLKGMLLRAGFEVEAFGTDTVILQAVPNPHPWFDAERVFREMIDELTHGSELVRAARNQQERLAMSFACKAAIKAGQPLAPREIRELFDQLFATRLPFHDVHGRPTTVRLTRGELERKFGR